MNGRHSPGYSLDDGADWWAELDKDAERYAEELRERERLNPQRKDTIMKFPAKGGGDFAIAPAGNHVGICNAIVDLGLQPGSAQYPDPKHQVYLRFELPQERVSYVKDGETVEGPMSIGRTFTASMHEKASLRKFVEAWFGKAFPSDERAADFEFRTLLGRRCLLNVTHKEGNGKIYANIVNATPLPKGMTSTEPQHNPSLYFSLDERDPAPDGLPEWLLNKIRARLPDDAKGFETSVAEKAEAQAARAEFDDDIPF